ncbi:MAG: hypothetical protein P8X74_02730 [Reinekea sp.]
MHCLILTDHRYHRSFDSVYLLAQQLALQPHIQVSVVSIGHSENAFRIFNYKTSSLLAVSPSGQFSFADRDNCFSSGLQEVALSEVDFVLPRLLPFNAVILKRFERLFRNAQFINTPEGIIETESKAFLLNVADLCPSIKLCTSLAEVKALLDQGDIVLKPLYSYGGKENILLTRQCCIYQQRKMSWDAIQPSLKQRFEAGEQWLAMDYLPDYSKGDKRVLVVAGKVIGATLRLPAPSQWLCNVSSGGKSIRTDITRQEMDMASQLAVLLDSKGIRMFGMDTLPGPGDVRYLSEINTLCPGGFHTLYHRLQQPQAVEMAIAMLVQFMGNGMRRVVA